MTISKRAFSLKKISDERQVDLEDCTRSAKDVVKHAKCLKKMFEHRGEFDLFDKRESLHAKRLLIKCFENFTHLSQSISVSFGDILTHAHHT